MQMKIVKKQMLRVLAFVMALCVIIGCFAGCGGEAAIKNPYQSPDEFIMASKVYASNSNYELEWRADAKAVVFRHKSSENYWSDILMREFEADLITANGKSPITITVYNNKTLDTLEVSSGSAMDIEYQEGKETKKACKIRTTVIEENGNIVGIRVYYFFEQYKIAVPVDYILKEDHIDIGIDSSKILEDGVEFKLLSVSLMNNFASVENSKDNNIFVPTGTGAIINCEETEDGNKEYEGKVFGDDLAVRTPMDRLDNTDIRMPVFGSYSEESKTGILGIIDKGAGAALINVNAAHRTGYSSVNPIFYVRGYDSFMKEYYGQNIFSQTIRPNDDISGQTFTVSYYPLFDDEANYNGMAKKYQSYLIKKGELVKTAASASPYSVTLLGGTNTTESFFGIPYNKIAPLTTFSEAESILKKLEKDNGILPQVRLLGYGDKGVRPGMIAGGSSYPSEYGDDDDLASLMNYCKKTNLFLDFDIVTFSESGNGFSLGDSAKTAIGYKSENFPTSPTRVQDKDNPYYAIGRRYLLEAADTAFEKAADYSAKAISLSSLGLYAYSDYEDDAYINCYLIEQDTRKIIANAKKNGYKTAVAGANAYAAAAADIVFDAPLNAGEYNVFDYDVPFYQMVFSSYKPMYSSPVNSEANLKKSVAKTLAYGMGIGYYITDGYVSNSDDLEEYKLYQTVFADNQKKINNTLVKENFISTYNKISGYSFVSYKLDTNGLATSVFKNGDNEVTLYTNLSDYNTIESPAGELKPYEYKIG